MTADDRTEAGFTLIEVLVALVLTALALASLPSLFEMTWRANRAAISLDRQAEVDAVIAFVERTLSEATPVVEDSRGGQPTIPFAGGANWISFVAPLTFSRTDGGLVSFDIRLGSDSDGRSGLILAWTPWHPKPNFGTASRRQPPPPTRSRMLVADADTFEVRYFGSGRINPPRQWVDAWARDDTIPDAVEIQLGIGNRRAVRSVSLQLRHH